MVWKANNYAKRDWDVWFSSYDAVDHRLLDGVKRVTHRVFLDEIPHLELGPKSVWMEDLPILPEDVVLQQYRRWADNTNIILSYAQPRNNLPPRKLIRMADVVYQTELVTLDPDNLKVGLTTLKNRTEVASSTKLLIPLLHHPVRRWGTKLELLLST